MRDEFAGLGVAIPDEMLGQDEAEMFRVWDINAKAMKAFLALTTQWRVLSVSGGLERGRLMWLGLDYSAVDVVLRRLGFHGDQVFRDVRVMEEAAIAAFDAMEA